MAPSCCRFLFASCPGECAAFLSCHFCLCMAHMSLYADWLLLLLIDARLSLRGSCPRGVLHAWGTAPADRGPEGSGRVTETHAARARRVCYSARYATLPTYRELARGMGWRFAPCSPFGVYMCHLYSKLLRIKYWNFTFVFPGAGKRPRLRVTRPLP